MRYTEAADKDRIKQEPKPKKVKKGEEKVLAGSEGYDYFELGRPKPMAGGNPWS